MQQNVQPNMHGQIQNHMPMQQNLQISGNMQQNLNGNQIPHQIPQSITTYPNGLGGNVHQMSLPMGILLLSSRK